MNRQPTLSNDLVELRPLRAADYERLYAVAADPKIWEQHVAHDRWQPKVFRAFFNDNLASGGCLLISDATTGAPIGSSRFQLLDYAPHSVEIGWTFLRRSHWGGRYNRAVKHLMINHALQTQQRVLLYVAGDNERSKRAAQKVGGVVIQSPELNFLKSLKLNYTSFLISRPLD